MTLMLRWTWLGGKNRETSAPVVLPIYSLGGDFRFSVFTERLLAVDFSSSVLCVSIMSPSSVEITCCCFRGFFLGEAPGGRSLVGIDRLLASKARDGDTVLVARGGTAVGGEAHKPLSTNSERLHSISRVTFMKTAGWLTSTEVCFFWAWQELWTAASYYPMCRETVCRAGKLTPVWASENQSEDLLITQVHLSFHHTWTCFRCHF